MLMVSSLLLALFARAEAARILGLFNVPSYSHQVVFRPIWLRLVELGHDVTVITPNPLEDNPHGNLRQIDVSFGYGMLHANLDLSDMSAKTWRRQFSEQMEVLGNIDREIMALEEVATLVRLETFDLIVAQWMSNGMMAIASKFDCPLVAITSLNAYAPMYDAVGNPTHPCLHPEYMSGLSDGLTFWERLQSVAFTLWMRWYNARRLVPEVEAASDRILGKGRRTLEQTIANVSMVFLNVNPLIAPPRPNLPTVVEFTGMHIRERQQLPKDLQEFLDDAGQGAIYLSLGSNVKSSSLPAEVRQKIIRALSGVPYRVLWKYERDELENKPENVMIRKWIPQQDVLGHENVKLFVTQGGSQSLEEAIHNEIPVVGLPVFSDQPRNIRRAAELGIGLGVDPKTVTEQELERTISEVVENGRYKDNVVKLSRLAKDQPMKPLEKVVWWIEYVIRNEGAYHLRSPYADVTWSSYLLLDVVAFVTVSLIIATCIVIKTVKIFCNNPFRYKIKIQ